jgi:hypothetical protein
MAADLQMVTLLFYQFLKKEFKGKNTFGQERIM